MKLSCFIMLFAVICGWVLQAQTNLAPAMKIPAAATNTSVATPPAPATPNAPDVKPQPPHAQTRITSDRVDFNLTAHEAIYRGHVRVDDPKMKLASRWLVADLPQEGGRVNHIVAVTNVVIDFIDDRGQTNHATCAKAVYSYEVKDGTTNELVTLTGNAKVENAEIIMTGEPIILNRANNTISAIHPEIISRQSLINVTTSTNSPPATANPPAAPK